MKSEFPPGADGWPDGLSRRDFVKLAGASIALAGAACTRQPLETIVAMRADQAIEWDGGACKVTNVAAANNALTREYRKGWEL